MRQLVTFVNKKNKFISTITCCSSLRHALNPCSTIPKIRLFILPMSCFPVKSIPKPDFEEPFWELCFVFVPEPEIMTDLKTSHYPNG